MTDDQDDKHFRFVVPEHLQTDDRLDGPYAVSWALLAALLSIIVTALIIWNLMAAPIA